MGSRVRRQLRVRTVAIAAAASVAATVGCCPDGPSRSAKRVSFVTDYAPIAFSFPAGWYENPDDHPYDLQCFSADETMNTGVFAYKRIDIAADAAPIDIFWEQVNDIKSKRRNVEEWEAIQTRKYDDKTVTSVTYVGDKGASRFCYRFSLIEFQPDDSRFAVALQVAIPGDWKRSKPVLQRITRSARPLPDQNSK